MPERFFPLGVGRVVTSGFGPRAGGFHAGVDFGRPGGSANMPVYAIQAGTVTHVGAAAGYGGPDPAGWIVVASDDAQGGGTLEYGHIVRLPHVKVGYRVAAGEQIAFINPDSATNGGTAPHLHVSDMPGGYAPGTKQDLMPRLVSAREPGGVQSLVARPEFNEYWVKSPSFHSRAGTKVDLFLLHTQEGSGNADSLARFLANPASRVSYHYTISQDPNDGGVTVCDVVDTDYASWSALSANNRSINLCFGGSTVNWSREQWLKQSKAIDVAAYLCVQDCKKYGIPLRVLAPPYKSAPPGISDHKYVTQFLKDGSHTDVGPSFPWDVFAKAVEKYGGQASGAAPNPPAATPAPAPPAKPPAAPAFKYPTETEMIVQVWEQLLGPRAKGWPQLGGRSLVDAVAEVLKSKKE